MDEQFVRDRITQPRLRKGVSEYKMSYDLGHSRGYVHLVILLYPPRKMSRVFGEFIYILSFCAEMREICVDNHQSFFKNVPIPALTA